jgi:hypothetical protein
LFTGVDRASTVAGEIVRNLTARLELVTHSTEPTEVAQLGRSTVYVINLGCWPIVTVDAPTVVLRQYNPANLVAQSRSGIGQIESKETDHIITDDLNGHPVGASAIAYHLPNIADLFGLSATVLRAETDLLLSYLGRVKRLKTVGAQPDPPLTLHGHRAHAFFHATEPSAFTGVANTTAYDPTSAQQPRQYPTERRQLR